MAAARLSTRAARPGSPDGYPISEYMNDAFDAVTYFLAYLAPGKYPYVDYSGRDPGTAGGTVDPALVLDRSKPTLFITAAKHGSEQSAKEAALLILRDFAAESFGAVVLSSVTADVIGRAMMGDHPFLSLPPFAVHGHAEYLLYGVLDPRMRVGAAS